METDMDEDELQARLAAEALLELEAPSETGPEPEPEPLIPAGMPARYKHCVSVYDAMFARAAIEEGVGLVYTGSLTNLITQDLGLGNAYYTVIMDKLKGMDCVEMLRRGGGPSPSQWLMKRAPTPEAYNTIERTEALQGQISKADKEILKQRQADLERRLERIENVLRSSGVTI